LLNSILQEVKPKNSEREPIHSFLSDPLGDLHEKKGAFGGTILSGRGRGGGRTGWGVKLIEGMGAPSGNVKGRRGEEGLLGCLLWFEERTEGGEGGSTSEGRNFFDKQRTGLSG